MSSFLIPHKIIENYEKNLFECPYCRNLIHLMEKVLSDPKPCDHCKKPIMIPYKLGAFWLFQKLGGGSMGTVFKAFHGQHHRSIYAIKTLRHDQKRNDRLIRALQREAQVASLFSTDPNIVNLICHGWDGDDYYMAMEFIPGETLLEKIERSGKLKELEALEIITKIIGAEKTILENGYLFRDMKPENVWLGKGNHVYVFDFGLCLPLEIASLDQGKLLEASPIYVPPERLTGEGEDVTSEIYSLGMVLYYAVTGQPYFTTAKEVDGLLKRHVSPFRLSAEVTKMNKINKDLADVITKMIKRHSEDRYRDMASLEEDINNLISSRL